MSLTGQTTVSPTYKSGGGEVTEVAQGLRNVAILGIQWIQHPVRTSPGTPHPHFTGLFALYTCFNTLTDFR